MMRTAEEIILTKTYEGEKYGGVPLFNLFDVINAINEARKEAIEECAEIALTPDHTTKFQIESLINELQ